MKKVFALVLVIALVLGCASAFAEDMTIVQMLKQTGVPQCIETTYVGTANGIGDSARLDVYILSVTDLATGNVTKGIQFGTMIKYFPREGYLDLSEIDGIVSVIDYVTEKEAYIAEKRCSVKYKSANGLSFECYYLTSTAEELTKGLSFTNPMMDGDKWAVEVDLQELKAVLQEAKTQAAQ